MIQNFLFDGIIGSLESIAAFNGILYPGAYAGFDKLSQGSGSGISLHLGHDKTSYTKVDRGLISTPNYFTLVTAQGISLQGNDEYDVTIAANNGSNPRIDIIYGQHEYQENENGSPLTVDILMGQANGIIPDLVQNATNTRFIIGYLYIQPGITAYSALGIRLIPYRPDMSKVERKGGVINIDKSTSTTRTNTILVLDPDIEEINYTHLCDLTVTTLSIDTNPVFTDAIKLPPIPESAKDKSFRINLNIGVNPSTVDTRNDCLVNIMDANGNILNAIDRKANFTNFTTGIPESKSSAQVSSTICLIFFVIGGIIKRGLSITGKTTLEELQEAYDRLITNASTASPKERDLFSVPVNTILRWDPTRLFNSDGTRILNSPGRKGIPNPEKPLPPISEFANILKSPNFITNANLLLPLGCKKIPAKNSDFVPNAWNGIPTYHSISSQFEHLGDVDGSDLTLGYLQINSDFSISIGFRGKRTTSDNVMTTTLIVNLFSLLNKMFPLGSGKSWEFLNNNTLFWYTVRNYPARMYWPWGWTDSNSDIDMAYDCFIRLRKNGDLIVVPAVGDMGNFGSTEHGTDGTYWTDDRKDDANFTGDYAEGRVKYINNWRGISPYYGETAQIGSPNNGNTPSKNEMIVYFEFNTGQLPWKFLYDQLDGYNNA